MLRVGITEYDGAGTSLRKFVYGPGIDEPICLIDAADANALYYYHLDGLGSVVALCDVNSVPVERYAYDVFGRPTIRNAAGAVIEESAFGNPYLFTGRAYDAETALYYYRARYYDYYTGRFLQPDPSGYGDGLNLYCYCADNPVGSVDSSGLCKESSWAANAWKQWSDFVNSNRTCRSLCGFTVGIGQSLSAFKEGVTQAIVDPLGTIADIPSDIAGIPDAIGQLYDDVTSPDAYTNGNAIGRLTGSTAIGIVTSEVGGRVLNGPTRGSTYGTTPAGRPLTRHYGTERGPIRNIPGSVVDNTIDTTVGIPVSGGKVVHYDPVNDVTVVTGRGGGIVSAHRGKP